MLSLPPVRRLVALLALVGGLALPALAVTSSPSVATQPPAAPARAMAALAAPDPGHPYSDPVYLPVRQRVWMDCYRDNDPQRCNANGTRDWQLNLMVAYRDEAGGVYAMGAGRLRVVEPRGPECGTGKGFGTYVQIDHGGGVSSGYTHLSNQDRRFMALDGQLVAAGQRIGTLGNTGAQNPDLCHRNYLDFFVLRGPGVHRFEMKTLTACVDGESQTWPEEMYPSHPTWNQLPGRTNGDPTELPTPDRPDEVADGTCISDEAPATFDQVRPASLATAGSDRLVARWAAAPSDNRRTMLQVQVKRPFGWNVEGYASVPAGQNSVILRTANGIANGRTVRVLVAHHNGVGWSRWSNPSSERVVGAPPAAPRFRNLKAFRTAQGAGVVLGWSNGTITGYPPTGWVAEVRRGSGPWRAVSLPRRTYYYRWNLARGTTYTVRVKARSGAGFSPYLARRVTTPR